MGDREEGLWGDEKGIGGKKGVWGGGKWEEKGGFGGNRDLGSWNCSGWERP